MQTNEPNTEDCTRNEQNLAIVPFKETEVHELQGKTSTEELITDKTTIEDDDFVEEVTEAMVELAGQKKKSIKRYPKSSTSIASRTRGSETKLFIESRKATEKSTKKSKLSKTKAAESSRKIKTSGAPTTDMKTKKRKQEKAESHSAAKKKTKKEGVQHNKDREYTQIKNSPSILTALVANMTAEQKKWVSDTGFGSLLNFNMKELPHKLCYKILQSFDHSSIMLRLRSGDLFIKEQDVAEVLGFPKGPRKIVLNSKSTVQDIWRKQFSVKEGHKITASAVCQKIKDSAGVNEMFKLNFLVVMSNILIQSLGKPYVNKKILNFQGDLDNASEYNWCALVVDSLIDSKPVWAENPSTKYYTGPLIFILLLYVDRVIHSSIAPVTRKVPVFLGWSDIQLRDRQTKELKENIFGRGMIISSHTDMPRILQNIPVDETPSNLAKEKVVEPPRSVDKSDSDDDDIIEQKCMKKVEHSLGKYLKYKAEFEAHMNLAMQIVPNNKRLAEIKEIVKKTSGYKFQDKDDPIQTDMHTDKEPAEGFTQAFEDEDFVMKVVEEVDREEREAAKKKAESSASIDDLPNFNLLTQTQPSSAVKDAQEPDTKEKAKEELQEKGAPQQQDKGKRHVKPGEALKSPYYVRRTNMGRKPCEDEVQLYDWLCCCTKPDSYVMFEWEGLLLLPDVLETMAEGRYVECGVIDVWAHLLNNKEHMRSNDSPSRLFVNPSTVTYTLHESQGNEADRFRRFKSNFVNLLTRNAKLNLQNVDLVNFAVLDMEHYYMISYNMKNPAWEVIDNSALQPDFALKYAGRPENLHRLFVNYLQEIKHPKATEIEKLSPNRLDMNWRTKKNSVDCGIFLMRHMECYMGGGTKNFKTDLSKEGKIQSRQLSRLRSLYTHTILLSQENSQADNVIWTAVQFASKEMEKIKQQIKP